MTDSLGNATVAYTATNAGADTLTFNAPAPQWRP